MTSTGIVLSPTCTLLMAAKAIARRPSSVVSSGLSSMIRVSLFLPLLLALSGTYTGSMLVPHEPVPGFLEKPITVNTKDFFDIGLKAAYDFKLYKSMNLQVNAGVQNIFNAYQNDFDKGADRDSGYIYGPSLPRSFFAGVKISY